jgi:hypothetical protein
MRVVVARADMVGLHADTMVAEAVFVVAVFFPPRPPELVAVPVVAIQEITLSV